MKTDEAADFSEKRVWLYCRTGGGEDGMALVVLVTPEFQVQGGRLFVVGQLDLDRTDPGRRMSASPTTGAMAWENVVYYYTKPLYPGERGATENRPGD